MRPFIPRLEEDDVNGGKDGSVERAAEAAAGIAAVTQSSRVS